MDRAARVKTIARIIEITLGGTADENVVQYMAEKIYSEVVADAVVEEREVWVQLSLLRDDSNWQ